MAEHKDDKDLFGGYFNFWRSSRTYLPGSDAWVGAKMRESREADDKNKANSGPDTDLSGIPFPSLAAAFVIVASMVGGGLYFISHDNDAYRQKQREIEATRIRNLPKSVVGLNQPRRASNVYNNPNLKGEPIGQMNEKGFVCVQAINEAEGAPIRMPYMEKGKLKEDVLPHTVTSAKVQLDNNGFGYINADDLTAAPNETKCPATIADPAINIYTVRQTAALGANTVSNGSMVFSDAQLGERAIGHTKNGEFYCVLAISEEKQLTAKIKLNNGTTGYVPASSLTPAPEKANQCPAVPAVVPAKVSYTSPAPTAYNFG